MIARLADALSLFRLLAVPVFVWAAATGRQGAFVAVLAASLLSDLVDGTLARWARSASTLGARLDSAGDFATYTSVPICAWLLWPDLIRREAGWVAAVVLSYLIPVLAGFVKFLLSVFDPAWGGRRSRWGSC